MAHSASVCVISPIQSDSSLDRAATTCSVAIALLHSSALRDKIMVSDPSISVNKLAEYMESKAARQRKILADRKYPDPEFKLGTFHREAGEAVAKYLCDGALDPTLLINQRNVLSQINAEKIGTARRINANIDAIDRFSEMLDDIDLMGAEAAAGHQNAPHLKYWNVKISVRPEIILRGDGPKGKKLIGAIKLHFSKTHPLTDDGAGYVSAVVQEYCKTHLCNDAEIVHAPYCQVIDVGSSRVFKGVKSTAQRMKDIAAECQNISGLWESI